ncbi:MAG: hypothetical protein ABFD49_11340 [Armatimonadota bacterium]|nr:hypothetical protein [bacterium]
MNSGAKKVGMAAAILSAAVVGLIFGLLVIKFMWSWVIPDIFPGAVEQGLIAKSISWYTAFKVAVFVAFLGGIAGFASHNKAE